MSGALHKKPKSLMREQFSTFATSRKQEVTDIRTFNIQVRYQSGVYRLLP